MGINFDRAFKSSRGGKVLSNKTIRHHHMLVSAILSKAVEWEVIKENKARLIKPPKVVRKEIGFLEEKDIEVQIRELASAPVQGSAMIKLFLLTGMSRNELKFTLTYTSSFVPPQCRQRLAFEGGVD